jgi:hypothetical protein
MATSNVFGGRFVALPEWAIPYISAHGTPRDLQVLACLTAMVNVYDKSVEVSVTEIASASHTSRETVKRSLKWLSDNGVITVTPAKKPKPNRYTINYTQKVLGSPVTHTRVMDDPLNGSPVTLSGLGDRVMDDPIKTSIDPASEQFFQPSRVILLLERENKETIEMAADAANKGEVVIFGADPFDKPSETKTDKRKPRPEVNDLTNYFVYHPKSVMSLTYSFQEVQILRRTMRLLLDGGLTRVAIKGMVDKFFGTDRMRGADSPVLMFSSKAVQKSLMSSVGVEVSDEDMSPVVALMLNDFQRSSQVLSWPESVDQELKKIVIMSCMDACYRYPEVVAQIVENNSNDVVGSIIKKQLSALNSLINWHLGTEDINRDEVMNDLSGIILPKELLAKNKSNLRIAADTIVEAVYNYRRVGHGC